MAKEKCIVCKKETIYDESSHIDYRYCYVEGIGQLCNKCYDEIYDNKKIVEFYNKHLIDIYINNNPSQ